MRIRPFDPLRPVPDLAAQVASVPYDVVTTDEARALVEGNPLSYLHVVRSEVDLAPEVDPYSDAVYALAAANLSALQQRGALVRHGRPALFVYRQRMGDHAQEGLVCCCSVDEYDRDLIKKHEKTRRAKEDDRTRHTLALRAHAGPVFLTYRDTDATGALIDEAVRRAPLFDFVAPDGVAHTVWEVAVPERWIEAFAAVPVAYVADGHHRSASASRAAAACRDENPAHTGEEEYNWFLAVLFPASRLRILAYNRVVHDLNGLAPDALRARIEKIFGPLEPDAAPVPDEPGRIAMFLDGAWWGIDVPAALRPADDPVRSLDVSILQEHLLAPLLGIDDPRTSDRIDFVGGIHGTARLEKTVRGGHGAVAFSLHPVTLDQLMAIADAGAIMPPKSTWFEPKLRSGLLVHTF